MNLQQMVERLFVIDTILRARLDPQTYALVLEAAELSMDVHAAGVEAIPYLEPFRRDRT